MIKTSGNSSTKSTDEVWQRLQALAQQPQASKASNQALLLFHQCRYAFRHERPEADQVLHQLVQLRQVLEYTNGSAAEFKCKQFEALINDEPMAAFENSYLAYHQLHEIDSPALVIWIAYDYTNDALDAGYYDEAIEAKTMIKQYSFLTRAEYGLKKIT